MEEKVQWQRRPCSDPWGIRVTAIGWREVAEEHNRDSTDTNVTSETVKETDVQIKNLKLKSSHVTRCKCWHNYAKSTKLNKYAKIEDDHEKSE